MHATEKTTNMMRSAEDALATQLVAEGPRNVAPTNAPRSPLLRSALSQQNSRPDLV